MEMLNCGCCTEYDENHLPIEVICDKHKKLIELNLKEFYSQSKGN